MNNDSLLHQILQNLEKTSGPDKYGWNTALCPFHDDQKHPNLRISSSGFKCMACGEKGNLQKLAIKLGIDIPSKKKPDKIDATYEYQNEQGNLLFQVIRYTPKSFKQRRPDGKSGWNWNLKDVRRVVYRLPDLLSSDIDKPVFIVEGEKSVDALVKLKLIATCSPMGAGKWHEEYSQFFEKRKVIILPDNDTPGELHATTIAKSLYKKCDSLKLIHLPGLSEKQDVFDWLNNGNSVSGLLQLVKESPEWQPSIHSEILNQIASFLKRFVVLTQSQIDVITLWIIHTYLFDEADTTPYLYITSPEKRSGKTRLLEVLELFVNKPWYTGRVTPAVLSRKIDAECPTLLLDEFDAAFKGDKEYSETLRAILNTGYRRGGKTSICTGQGANIGYTDLETYCPKAFAGIGKLPDTIEDRSIPIVLKRRSIDEQVERFKKRKVEAEASIIKRDIIKLISSIILSDVEPDIPTQLDDRASDCWEILFIIADSVSGDWPERVKSAALVLMTGESRQDESRGVKLLTDIAGIFEQVEQISSENLVDQLNKIEESSWDGINTRRLASSLKPFGIKPSTIRIGDKTPKGYRKSDFSDTFSRYLSWDSMRSATSATPASNDNNLEAKIYPQHLPENTEKMLIVADVSQAQASLNVADVADRTPETEEKATFAENFLLESWRKSAIPTWRRIIKESRETGDKTREEYAHWMLVDILEDPEYKEDEE